MDTQKQLEHAQYLVDNMGTCGMIREDTCYDCFVKDGIESCCKKEIAYKKAVQFISLNQRSSSMKKLPTSVVEVENEGLISLLGKTITVFCANYIYTGVLEGVNESCIKLTKASIVYETGAFTDKTWKDAQALPNDLYVQLGLIECFTILK